MLILYILTLLSSFVTKKNSSLTAIGGVLSKYDDNDEKHPVAIVQGLLIFMREIIQSLKGNVKQ